MFQASKPTVKKKPLQAAQPIKTLGTPKLKSKSPVSEGSFQTQVSDPSPGMGRIARLVCGC
jgi:hypothetical protein